MESRMTDDISQRPWWRLSRAEMNIRGGCQCKLPGLDLEEILKGAVDAAGRYGAKVRLPPYPQDCASVEAEKGPWLLSTELGPLPGVDLHLAGRIAALHGMSDIYACGGLPKWALVNLVAQENWPKEYVQAVLTGILLQCANEKVQVVGGQTIVGPEAMAGLAVIGSPKTSYILKKSGARVEDHLLLSKPLGIGMVLRAYKLGLVDDKALDSAVSVMLLSNAMASAAALAAGVHACTDVTGFGLLGHVAEMLVPDLGATLSLSQLPVLDEAIPLMDLTPTTWIRDNRDYAVSLRPVHGNVDPAQSSVVFDPQTNGGLLVAADVETATKLQGEGFTTIGRVTQSHVIELVD
jgi:selenide,water dikinase